MSRAADIVDTLLGEARPRRDPVKDALLADSTPEHFKGVVIGMLNDEDGDYHAEFSNEPTDQFIKEMIRIEKTEAEAAAIWPFWDAQVEEHGDWVLERGDRFSFDEDSFKKDWSENYRGKFADADSYARDWHENTGERIPEHLERYIDWERYGTDLLAEMETYEHGGYIYVFWNR